MIVKCVCVGGGLRWSEGRTKRARIGSKPANNDDVCVCANAGGLGVVVAYVGLG